MAGTAADAARLYAELTVQKRTLNDRLKAVQSLLNDAEKDVVEKLVDEGIAKITVESTGGRWTISASTLAWARLRDGTQRKAVELLTEEGLEGLLTINSTKLSAMYREDVRIRESGVDGLPVFSDEFLTLVDVEERTRVNARRV